MVDCDLSFIYKDRFLCVLRLIVGGVSEIGIFDFNVILGEGEFDMKRVGVL